MRVKKEKKNLWGNSLLPSGHYSIYEITCLYWKSSLVLWAVKKGNYPLLVGMRVKKEKKNLWGNSLLPSGHYSIHVISDLQKHLLLQHNTQISTNIHI